MSVPAPPPPPPPRESRTEDAGSARVLTGWKAIAGHFGISTRTAQRWHQERGLPVYYGLDHHPWATVADLDAWRTKEDRSSWWRRIAAGGIVILAAAAAGAGLLFVALRPGAPASVSVVGTEVRVRDEAGRVCWTFALPGTQHPEHWGLQVTTLTEAIVEDIDGDGTIDVLVSFLPGGDSSPHGRLMRFDRDGRLRWQIEPGRAVAVAGRDHPKDYGVTRMHVVSIKGVTRLLTVAAHRTWASSQVALLDVATGAVVEEFWHPGVLTHSLLSDVDGDGSEDVVLAGVNNPGGGAGRPGLMVLSLPFSKTPPAPRSMLGGLSSGGPREYVLFPRSDISFRLGIVGSVVRLDFEEPSDLVVQLRVGPDGGLLTYKLDVGASSRREVFDWTSDVATVHDDLAWRGQLAHRLTDAELRCLGDALWLGYVPNGNDPSFDDRWRACEHPRLVTSVDP